MTYVLSDIHGEIARWEAMLALIQFSDDDTMYVLGDVIDRNPHGIEILQDIMSRPNVKFIQGNHEAMMIDAFWGYDHYNARRLWTGNGGSSTYRTMRYRLSESERLQILRYVKSAPDFMEIEVNGRQFYLVHGYVGETRHDRIWARPEPPPTEPPIPGKTVIVGHTSVYWLNMYIEGHDEEAPLEIWHGPGLIAIDCGCGSGYELSRLACLRLDDMSEFYV